MRANEINSSLTQTKVNEIEQKLPAFEEKLANLELQQYNSQRKDDHLDEFRA